VNCGDVAPNSLPSTVLSVHNIHTAAANSYRTDCKSIQLVLQLVDTVSVDLEKRSTKPNN
jgi:hypothetical protein